MAVSILHRRGPNSQVNSYTGPVGEIVINTDENTIHVQDGKIAGGTVLAKRNDIPTKVSQLTNDANFSQLNTVTATVDANIGIPSATVSVTGSGNSKGLSFSFKNLKGERGDTGPQGPQGIQGPQGPAGALSTISGGAKILSLTSSGGSVTVSNHTIYGGKNYGTTGYGNGGSTIIPVIERDNYGRIINTGSYTVLYNCDCNCQD